MKNSNRLLALAGASLLLAWPGQSMAQSQAVGDDGIAASPKVRQMLNERKARSAATGTRSSAQVAGYKATGDDGITASPKLRQMLDERKAAAAASATGSTAQVAGYKATGDDGIAASPKLRQMLDERRHVVEVAPLK